MPSTFETLLADQLPSLRDAFGIPGCSYLAPDGVTVATGLTLVVQRDETREVDRSVKAIGEMQTAEIRVLIADLPAAPAKDGRFAVPGVVGPEAWTIQATPTIEKGRYVCQVSRSGVERILPRRAKE